MTEPTTCRLWRDPETALSRGGRARFKTVEVIDAGRIEVQVLRCPDCGQLWFWECEEDRMGFDEALYITFVPIEGPGHLAALRAMPRPLDRGHLPACITRDVPMGGGAGPARRHWKGD